MAEPHVFRRCCALHLPKKGNRDDEYEDACAHNPTTARFAIADGATDSSFAELWARQLVDGFVALPTSASAAWSAWLPALHQHWADIVDAKELPWFAKNKAQKGAFATFLGLTFSTRGWFRKTLCWQAVAVGDACLFQVRADQLHVAFPIGRADDFNTSPALIGSRSAYAGTLAQNERRREGDCRAGDFFWLMTDALSQWFLQEVEAGKKPWHKLEPYLLDDPPTAGFADWMEELRQADEIRNDDVTLMGIAF